MDFKTTLKEERGKTDTYSVVSEVLLKTEKHGRVFNLSHVILSKVVANLHLILAFQV